MRQILKEALQYETESENGLGVSILSFRKYYEGGGLTMRKKYIRETVRIEITENALPMEKALTQLAKVIAAGMFAEKQRKKNPPRGWA